MVDIFTLQVMTHSSWSSHQILPLSWRFSFLFQDLTWLQGPGRGRELAAVLWAVPSFVEGAPVGVLWCLTQPPPVHTGHRPVRYVQQTPRDTNTTYATPSWKWWNTQLIDQQWYILFPNTFSDPESISHTTWSFDCWIVSHSSTFSSFSYVI